MLKKVVEYIKEYGMIEQGDRIVTGVSGGADSVCLFHALLELMPVFHHKLFVVHINHGIRGRQADEDEEFVRNMCAVNGIWFTSVLKDVPAIAKEEGLTEEEAGRKVRYEEFYKCFYENKCNKIAIAHNKNDNAETILFHLFRGSGIKGLSGIRPVRDEIIRPLLNITRAEIEMYLEDKGITYREDATNFTMDYTRNKIRLGILPLAEQAINSKAIEHITKAGQQLSEIEEYLFKMTQSAYEWIVSWKKDVYYLQVKEFNQEDIVIKKNIIREILAKLIGGFKDLEAFHIDLVLGLCGKETGKRLNLLGGVIAERGYDDIKLYKGHAVFTETMDYALEEQTLNIPGSNILPECNIILNSRLIKYKKNMIIPQNGCTKWFDYDKIENTVLIRTRKSGDFICINKQGNKKKLKQFFIDEKIPKSTRDSLPLITDGSHIMWIPGYRRSEAYKVEEGTRLILEINLDGGICNE